MKNYQKTAWYLEAASIHTFTTRLASRAWMKSFSFSASKSPKSGLAREVQRRSRGERAPEDVKLLFRSYFHKESGIFVPEMDFKDDLFEWEKPWKKPRKPKVKGWLLSD